MSGRVLLVNNSMESVVNFRRPLIEQLVSRGCVVYVAVPKFDTEFFNLVEDWGAHVVEFDFSRGSFSPFRFVRSIISLVDLQKKLSVDSVIAFFLVPSVVAACSRVFSRVPRLFAVVEGVGYSFTKGARFAVRRTLFQGVMFFLTFVSFKFVDRAVFLNDEDLSFFRKNFFFPESRSKVVDGIGVDLSRFSYVKPPTDKLTFVMVARLVRDKGICEFISAARIVKQIDPRVQFVIAGQLDDNPTSVSLSDVESWQREELITWLGYCDVRVALARSSVFVLPSYREGFPRSTQEAMAVGRAIITTDVAGCRSTCIDGYNGFLVRPADVESLAEAMTRFIFDKTLVVKFGLNSRSWAVSKFDDRVQSASILDFFGFPRLD